MSPALAWAAMGGWLLALAMTAVLAPTKQARRWARVTLIAAVAGGLTVGVIGGVIGLVVA